jgi:hypothetical protein
MRCYSCPPPFSSGLGTGHGRVFSYFAAQKTSCKIWHIIMRCPVEWYAVVVEVGLAAFMRFEVFTAVNISIMVF